MTGQLQQKTGINMVGILIYMYLTAAEKSEISSLPKFTM